MKASLLKPLLAVAGAAALVAGLHAIGPRTQLAAPDPTMVPIDGTAATTGGTSGTSGTTGPTPCAGSVNSCGVNVPNCVDCTTTTPANATANCNSGTTCGFTCNANYQPDGHGGCMPVPCGGSVTSCGTNAVNGCRNCSATLPLGGVNGSAACSSGTTCTYACGAGYLSCDGGQTCSACSTPANATPACSGSTCGFICKAGYQPSGNTCVQSTCLGTPQSCGTVTPCTDCTAALPPGAVAGSGQCVNAKCTYSCDSTHKNCDNTSSSCAACPMPVNSTPVCTGPSTCGFACNAGYTPANSACVSKSFSTEY